MKKSGWRGEHVKDRRGGRTVKPPIILLLCAHIYIAGLFANFLVLGSGARGVVHPRVRNNPFIDVWTLVIFKATSCEPVQNHMAMSGFFSAGPL